MGFSVNRDDIRRLEKAAKDKDKRKLMDWASAFEFAISSEIYREYDKAFKDQLANSLDLFILTFMYTLATDGNVTIKKNKAEYLLDTLMKNFDKFRTEEYKPEDYLGRLKSLGVNLIDYRYEHRVTSIVSYVLSDEYTKEDEKKIIKFFEEQNVIFIKLDNLKNREKEVQVKKNVNIVNISDRIYYLGTSEIIELYKQYAGQCRKPIIDGRFILEDEIIVEEE